MMARKRGQDGAAGVWILVIVVVLIAAFVAWRWYTRVPLAQPQAAAPASSVASNPAVSVSTAPEYPVAAIATRTPEPAVAASVVAPQVADPRQSLLALPGAGSLASLLLDANLIPRMVATVNALPQRQLPAKVLPVTPPRGNFKVAREDGRVVMAADNAARYAAYLDLAEHVDLGAAVAWYVRHYDAFEHAYRQLGYPLGHFNDRLVTVIDHLLATPRPARPLVLVAAKGGWAFADPKLEALSAGQKILLRLAPQDRHSIDARLRKLRGMLSGSIGRDARAGR